MAGDGTIIRRFRKIIGGNTNSELSERWGKRGTQEANEGTEKGVGFQRHSSERTGTRLGECGRDGVGKREVARF